ncbi:hypothetical protein BS026_RS08700 [Vibrio parahaemolyticus]|uniref:hypothetical protein n=1 Tax=Vibrio owensii TaxID=696485 RepID=UPI004067B831|nr:hypothetical protein [Vibrio parahaemolyticus]EJG2035353.1 hypothetical protein [Vibrio parahaemolyticus]
MSSAKKRIDTLNVIVTGSIIASEHECNLVQGEFNEVHRCSNVSPKQRKHLLQILHATRGLDTALGTFARLHAIPYKTPALGSYIWSFANHTKPGLQHLTQAERHQFQTEIVDKRNHFMHQAGAFPNQDRVVNKILSEMQTCLARVSAL